MQPPIPPVEAICPSCGHVIEKSRMKFCSNCGAALHGSSSGALSGLKIFGVICLGMLALPLAGGGACFLLFFSMDTRKELGLFGIGAGCLLAAMICIWGMVKLI